MATRDELIEHAPRLRRYACALIRNHDLADDLVQDTLERALRNVEKYQSGTDLRAWLFTIMHNAFAGQARRTEARTIHVSLDDETISEREFAMAGSQANAFEMRDLDFALQRLPVDQRQVLLLVGLEEMSYTDVAHTLGIPVGTVMSRLSRGRERLRALMAGVQNCKRLQVVR